jgi:hypothetical protein
MGHPISRRSALIAAVAGVGAAASRAAPASAGNGTGLPLQYTQDFESGMDSWTPASDHHERAYQISRTNKLAYSGSYSLEYFLNGLNDDGTIWVERRFTDLPPKTRVGVTVMFHLHSDVQTRFNTWPVVAYAGAVQPLTEADFTIVGQTNQVAGWAPYALKSATVTDNAGGLWMAVGFGATWETSRTYHLDLFDITVLL